MRRLIAAALLATWGLFVRLNTSAEELEPHAMHDVQAEDKVIEGEDVKEDGKRHAADTGQDYHGDIETPNKASTREPTPSPLVLRARGRWRARHGGRLDWTHAGEARR